MATDIEQFSNARLLKLYSDIMKEMSRRGLTRTANNPVADLGELLFCNAMGWRREHQQGKNFDALTRDGKRIQIKSRRLTRTKPPSRSGTIYDKDGFDQIALVLFNEDFNVSKAIIIPRAVLEPYLRWSARQSGWFVSMTQGFWKEPGLLDVTELVSRSCRELGDDHGMKSREQLAIA